jgi:sec-independent protein translocase protein TatA
MGSFSIWHWLIVLAVVLLLFGTGRVSNLMGDLAKGVKAFKKGLQEDEPTPDKPKALSSEDASLGGGGKSEHKDEANHH